VGLKRLISQKMSSVIFDVTVFKTRYPEFAAVNAGLLGACFDEATLYLSNGDGSRVQNVTKRTLMLNMLTAHIAFIGGALSPDGQAKPVGRLSSGSEGSVSASFEGPTPGSSSWFMQSQYGAAFWQASAMYRGFQYRSQPTVY